MGQAFGEASVTIGDSLARNSQGCAVCVPLSEAQADSNPPRVVDGPNPTDCPNDAAVLLCSRRSQAARQHNSPRRETDKSNRKQSYGDDRDECGLEGQKHDGQNERDDRSPDNEYQPDPEAQKQ